MDSEKIGEAIAWMRAARDAGKTIYICGNGGSASIASQMVVDIVKGASLRKKARFKMIGLTDSMATLSAYANDEGYESVFVEPLKNFAESGDLLIGISRSRVYLDENKVGCVVYQVDNVVAISHRTCISTE